MKHRTVEEALGVKDITSGAMQDAVNEWFNLYYGVGDGGADGSQRIPYAIVDGYYKAAFGEYSASPGGQGGKDARMGGVLAALDAVRTEAFEQTLVGGEGFLKPSILDGGFAFSYVPRQHFLVLRRGIGGDITDVALCARIVKGKDFFTLTERRALLPDGLVSIQNRLFQSGVGELVGRPVSLRSISETAGLEPDVTLPVPMGGLGLVPLKTPLSNCVDGSPGGVSIYAAAAGRIRAQYWHEQRTRDEYEVTVPALYMSEDEFDLDEWGRPVVPKYARAIDDEPRSVGRFCYNPTPNQAQLEARANQNLRDIENLAGLRRGFLSCVDSEERTATEVLSSSARFAHNISLLQGMWAGAVNESFRVCDLLGRTYLDWDKSAFSPPVIDWGDGVLYDEEKDFRRHLELCREGVERPEVVLGWMHNMPYGSEDECRKIRERYGAPGRATAAEKD